MRVVVGSSARRREVQQYIKQMEAEYKRKQSKELLERSSSWAVMLAQMAMPGTGFRAGTGVIAEPTFGFIGLGPGAGPRGTWPA
jgi:hypothetical protein